MRRRRRRRRSKRRRRKRQGQQKQKYTFCVHFVEGTFWGRISWVHFNKDPTAFSVALLYYSDKSSAYSAQQSLLSKTRWHPFLY